MAQVQDPPAYQFPPPTTENLDFADLAILDFSKASTVEGRKELAGELVEAMRDKGFFYVINHGYTQAQTNRIMSISNLFFDNVDDEEKDEFTQKEQDVYEGYKFKKIWEVAPGVKDSIEFYHMNHALYHKDHPRAVRPYLKDIEHFIRHNHFNVLFPVLRLMAIGLGLPEETLVEQHDFDAYCHSGPRFMKYHPRTADIEQEAKNVWLKGHTDLGSVTLLWSQPISALQIMTKDNQWKWVRHIPNALVVNSGDMLGFLCGGYYPPTRHRVVQPPKDQAGLKRLGTFYFAMPKDDTVLTPHKESPVLQKEGINPRYDPEQPPTAGVWRRGRTRTYGRVPLTAGKEPGVEEQVIAGVVVRHYN